MSSTPEFNQEQLTAARAQAWRQAGEPALTLEAVRDWIAPLGLVPFEPLGQGAAPSGSFVEATLGAANAEPTPEQILTARGLLSRLASEGVALPLNLNARPGELPDYVVTAQVFSYVFTLRGDKGYKLPPTTTGPFKVTPLTVKVYEALSEKGALSAAELATELGRELTEAAILRGLNELWAQLRVVPLYGPGDEPTLWELTTKRFLKPIKAGSNAGSPTALSALVSLYLAQAVAATEEQIAAYLSPVTSGSRVHEVLLALTTGRQLETMVLEGQELIYIPGTLPEFAAVEVPVDASAEEAEAAGEGGDAADTPRIRSFTSNRTPDLRGKPAARGVARPRAAYGSGSAREGRPERERRPFDRAASGDRKAPSERKPFERKPYERKPATGGKPFERKPYERKAATDRPTRTPREGNAFTRPWEEDRKQPRPGGAPESFAKFRKPARELGPREEKGLPPEKRKYERPVRAEGEDRAARPRPSGRPERSSWKPSTRKPFGERPERSAGAEGEAPRRPYAAKKPFGSKPFRAKPFGAKSFGSKPAVGRSYGPRKDGDGGAKRFEGGGQPFPRKPRPFNADGPPREGGSDRPKTFGSAGKRPGGFGARPAGRPGGGFGTRFGATSGPRSEGRPAARPGAKFASRPGGKPGGFNARPGGRPGAKFASRPGGKPGGKPRFGGAKPGGSGGARGTYGAGGKRGPKADGGPSRASEE